MLYYTNNAGNAACRSRDRDCLKNSKSVACHSPFSCLTFYLRQSSPLEPTSLHRNPKAGPAIKKKHYSSNHRYFRRIYFGLCFCPQGSSKLANGSSYSFRKFCIGRLGCYQISLLLFSELSAEMVSRVGKIRKKYAS